MAVNINRNDAEAVLLQAYKAKCQREDASTADIKTVLQGTHKTYRYILVTGILAKATNENVNPIALQAGASIEGAYDARSLCHSVLVPFERDFLANALGGSNEPFLNKPARFTHLSTSNAVRRGNDTKTLMLVLKIFESIKTSSQAQIYLACVLETLNERVEKLASLNDNAISHDPTIMEVYNFIFQFLHRSYEGESCAVVVATLEKLYYKSLSERFSVVAHKVNQSGSSSKEVGDIDIFREESFHYAIEVKDKNFTTHDLEHAISKMQNANGVKGQFIYGTNAKFEIASLRSRILEYEEQGFMILFQDILTYAKTMIFKTELSSTKDFIDAMMATAIEINSKEETRQWIQDLLKANDWK